MIAVVVIRQGVLPVGAQEAVAEAGGRAVLIGEGTAEATLALTTATEVDCAEVGPFAPGAWADALVPHLRAEAIVVLPASADGRDLAPRLAFALGRPLLAGAIAVTADRVVLARAGGLQAEEHRVSGPIVATLEPGVRGFEPGPVAATVNALRLPMATSVPDAEVTELLPPDPATMDLAEAPRIVAGGAGLGGPLPFLTLAQVATKLAAAHGASRVAADAGWAPAHRFIGTTGVIVQPKLYIALGISGAVQHVSGLGDPDHIIAVNTDASAPMMAMADLAIVTDAQALLVELARQLEVQLEPASPSAEASS